MTNPHGQPDIFITGTMKGGTTVLYDYICEHDAVTAGKQKEIHYFSLHYKEGRDWYENHFLDVPATGRSIDASPTYFDCANTLQIPQLIQAYTADPRVIVITRDPIARCISHFVHLQKIVKTPELQDMTADDFFGVDFQEAYRQTTPHGFFLNLALDFSLYSRKLKMYRQTFEPHQLLVLDNSELKQDATAVMRRVFDFLNLPFQDNDIYGQVRYSNGSTTDQISLETFERLSELLHPDYQHFCQMANIEFNKEMHIEQRKRCA